MLRCSSRRIIDGTLVHILCLSHTRPTLPFPPIFTHKKRANRKVATASPTTAFKLTVPKLCPVDDNGNGNPKPLNDVYPIELDYILSVPAQHKVNRNINIIKCAKTLPASQSRLRVNAWAEPGQTFSPRFDYFHHDMRPLKQNINHKRHEMQEKKKSRIENERREEE